MHRHVFSLFIRKRHIYWAEMRPTTYTTGFSGDGGRCIALSDIQLHPYFYPAHSATSTISIAEDARARLAAGAWAGAMRAPRRSKRKYFSC